MTVRPEKTRISLGICPVGSVFAVRMKKVWVLSYPLSACEVSDQTAWIPRLIWVRWAHSHSVVLSCCGSYLLFGENWFMYNRRTTKNMCSCILLLIWTNFIMRLYHLIPVAHCFYAPVTCNTAPPARQWFFNCPSQQCREGVGTDFLQRVAWTVWLLFS